jgi:uncharacterized protein (TIGR03437 family)
LPGITVITLVIAALQPWADLLEHCGQNKNRVMQRTPIFALSFAAACMAQTAAIDLTGTWQFETASLTATFQVIQTGNNISGQMIFHGAFCGSVTSISGIAGTVETTQAPGYSVAAEAGGLSLTGDVAPDANSINGTFTCGGTSGNWFASRIATVAIAAVDNAAFSGGASPGSIATIFGKNFAPAAASAQSAPLPQSLNGVSVTVGGVPAPLWYAGPTQINFQMPVETPVGQVTIQVTPQSGVPDTFVTTVAQAQPGIFTYAAGRAAATNQDGTLNGPLNGAPAGTFLTAYLTGIGPTTLSLTTGAVTPSAPLARAMLAATATIGGSAAAIEFLGLTPGSIGLAQANITVPQLAPGDYPLVITVGGQPSQGATVTVGQ